VVNQVLEGNVAARDGRIKVGDRLVGIGNAAGALVEFRGKSPAQVAVLMQGPDGTKVKLIVGPKDSDERVAIELTRARIGFVARRVKTDR
jgi:carboxyl-terminal processing protease